MRSMLPLMTMTMKYCQKKTMMEEMITKETKHTMTELKNQLLTQTLQDFTKSMRKKKKNTNYHKFNKTSQLSNNMRSNMYIQNLMMTQKPINHKCKQKLVTKTER